MIFYFFNVYKNQKVNTCLRHTSVEKNMKDSYMIIMIDVLITFSDISLFLKK